MELREILGVRWHVEPTEWGGGRSERRRPGASAFLWLSVADGAAGQVMMI